MILLRLCLTIVIGCAFVQSGPAQQIPFSCGDCVAPNSIGLNAAKLARIDATAEKWIAEKKIVGCSAMILKDGKVGYINTWGLQNREQELPMQRDSIFRIYSMSKPITTIAALQLIEQGKLELDDPVSETIPEFKNMQVMSNSNSNDDDKALSSVPAVREITIRDLMTHTAGMTYGFFGDTPVDQEYRKAGVLILDKNLEQMTEKLGHIPLLYQPGTRFHYSASVDVLGRVVEVVSQMSLADYMEENIFAPLSMCDTCFMVPQEKRNRFAEMYMPGNNGGELRQAAILESSRYYYEENQFFSGGGGLCSTLDDYGRFAQMLANRGELDGTRILKSETVDLAFTNQLDRLEQPPRRFEFGLGFAIEDHGKKGTDYSWGGAAGTRFWSNPDKNLVVLFMVQIKPTPESFAETIRDLAYESIVD